MLAVLVTDPKYQRRGAGNLLVEWGAKRADEDGLMAYLEATDEGRQLYERHGFRFVKDRFYFARDFGRDDEAMEHHSCMLRPAPR